MNYETITLKEHPDIARLIRAAAPKYRKHKATVEYVDHVTPYGTYWSGGSCNSYWHVRASTMGGYIVGPVPGPTAPPQFGGGEAKRFDIPEGDAVIKLGTFCGRPATAHVYINNQEES